MLVASRDYGGSFARIDVAMTPLSLIPELLKVAAFNQPVSRPVENTNDLTRAVIGTEPKCADAKSLKIKARNLERRVSSVIEAFGLVCLDRP